MMKLAPAVGINSGSGNDCIIFLDYDNIRLTEVVKDAYKIKVALKLGPFEVVETNKGYHVMFWWDVVNEATRDTAIALSQSDEAFKKKPKKTIRVGGKYNYSDLRRVGVFKFGNDELSVDGLLRMELAAKVGSCMPMSVNEGLESEAPDRIEAR